MSCSVESASAGPEVTAAGVSGDGQAISASSLSVQPCVGAQGYTMMQVLTRQITQETANDEAEQTNTRDAQSQQSGKSVRKSARESGRSARALPPANSGSQFARDGGGGGASRTQGSAAAEM